MALEYGSEKPGKIKEKFRELNRRTAKPEKQDRNNSTEQEKEEEKGEEI